MFTLYFRQQSASKCTKTKFFTIWKIKSNVHTAAVAQPGFLDQWASFACVGEKRWTKKMK
jgi:hypothetical protein